MKTLEEYVNENNLHLGRKEGWYVLDASNSSGKCFTIGWSSGRSPVAGCEYVYYSPNYDGALSYLCKMTNEEEIKNDKMYLFLQTGDYQYED